MAMTGRIILKIGKGFIVTGVIASVVACASPAERVDRQATRFEFTRSVVPGNGFRHVVYRNGAAGGSGILHVYLEGDGLPWINRGTVSADPTPRRPLMLGLMALDGTPSLYLGRPCYHGFATVSPCSPLHWTQKRYSERIAASMATALTNLLAGTDVEQLVLFGYSGGGVLAMLLAERLPQTHAVITLAGNLDPDAWTVHHGFTALEGSLNPARRPPLHPDIVQLHLAGSEDQHVPPSLVAAATTRQVNASLLVLEGYDHTCCWKEIWPVVLEAVEQDMDWSVLVQRAKTAQH